MIKLQCPACAREVGVDADQRNPPSTCPHCGTRLPNSPIGPADDLETDTHTNEHPTLVGIPPARYPFLAPPQESGELGRLAHYRVLKRLGHGGMGIVFEAEDTHLRRLVALKVMNPEAAAADPLARHRFLRAARLNAGIRSDHIVTIHQVGQVADLPFLAMELLQGETLASWLQRGQRAPPAQVVDFGLQIARGLEVAHATGLIHRDIKPANIFLESPFAPLPSSVRTLPKKGSSLPRTPQERFCEASLTDEGRWGDAGTAGWRVKILDFGLARPAHDTGQLTQVGLVVGTPAYMAPEQAESQTIDTRCDLFSLGCVLYELAAGLPPFTGPSAFAVLTAVAVRDPRSPRAVNPEIPPELASLILWLLAKKPADRPASAHVVVEAFEALAEQHPELQPPSRPGPRPRHPGPMPTRRWRRQFLLAGVGALACLLGFFAWGWLFRGDKPEQAAGVPDARVTDDEVVFGMSGPFTGPTSELGRSLRVGMETWFNHVNDTGGIAGRKIRLVALDDGYEPKRALDNIRELSEEYRVLGFIGNVGTPTAELTLPYVQQQRMLFFGAFTGAQLLRRTPPDRYVFNFRASLQEETAAAVRYLIDRKIRPEQIAVFAQQDSYGDGGFRGVVRALRPYGRTQEQILRTGYVRNTLQVQSAVQEILRHEEIRAVVMVPTYRPAARFIQLLQEAGREVIFTSTSFVDSEALAEELRQQDGHDNTQVIVTQVVPPVDSHASLILQYRERLRHYHPSETANAVSLEGYLTAALLTEGLRRAGANLTTETLVDALESIHDFDLGIGQRITFGPSEHQASHKVWGLQLDPSGRFVPLDLD